MAGAGLLGRDAASLCAGATSRRIQDLFHNEGLIERLTVQMNQVVNPLADQIDRASPYVAMFRRGFLSL